MENFPKTMDEVLVMIKEFTAPAIMKVTLVVQIAFALAFLISAFVIAGNPFAGFSAVLMGLVYVGFVPGTYFAIFRDPTNLQYGAVVGASFMLAFISLETAIFWGQYAKCDYHTTTVLRNEVHCEDVKAMSSLCAFASLLFVVYVWQVIVLAVSKNIFLGIASSTPAEDEYDYVHDDHGDGETAALKSSDSSFPSSVDL